MTDRNSLIGEDGLETYLFKKHCVDFNDTMYVDYSNVRNEQKHRETCLKNRKKRKSKKR